MTPDEKMKLAHLDADRLIRSRLKSDKGDFLRTLGPVGHDQCGRVILALSTFAAAAMAGIAHLSGRSEDDAADAIRDYVLDLYKELK